jgi:hypothetical protein
MDPKGIPDQANKRTAQDRVSGLADDRQLGRSDAAMVSDGARDDGGLRGLLVGRRRCPGGYCELCPIAMQIECEKDIQG